MTLYNVEEAIDLFCSASTTNATATEAGDYTTTNKAYAQLIDSLSFIKTNQAFDSLYCLLDAPDVGTRLWTASYLLSLGYPRAEEVLTDLASMNDIHGLGAKTTLSEWRAGRLKPLV